MLLRTIIQGFFFLQKFQSKIKLTCIMSFLSLPRPSSRIKKSVIRVLEQNSIVATDFM